MCTLVADARQITRGILHLGANRDEALGRAAAPPQVLRERPLVLGGRDLQAGGTWLALRATAPRRVVAVLNRPEPASGEAHGSTTGAVPAPQGPRRSRGLLCLEAALAPDLATAESEAWSALERYASAPYNLVLAEAGALRLLSFDGRTHGGRDLTPAIHVIAHGAPDDRADPRVRAAWEGLQPLVADKVTAPEGILEAFARVLRAHDSERAACRHGQGYGTVSSMLLSIDLAGDDARWLFADGPPCRTAYRDVGDLVSGARRALARGSPAE